MSEFKEIYIRDAFKNNIALSDQNENDANETVDVSYIQVNLILILIYFEFI